MSLKHDLSEVERAERVPGMHVWNDDEEPPCPAADRHVAENAKHEVKVTNDVQIQELMGATAKSSIVS